MWDGVLAVAGRPSDASSSSRKLTSLLSSTTSSPSHPSANGIVTMLRIKQWAAHAVVIHDTPGPWSRVSYLPFTRLYLIIELITSVISADVKNVCENIISICPMRSRRLKSKRESGLMANALNVRALPRFMKSLRSYYERERKMTFSRAGYIASALYFAIARANLKEYALLLIKINKKLS